MGEECWGPARWVTHPASLSTGPAPGPHTCQVPGASGGNPGAIRATPLPSRWPDTSPRDESGNRLSRHLRRAKHCARQATRVVYKGHDPPRGRYHHNHFTDGKVEAHGQGQTWTGQRVAWSSAAKVLTSQDLQESRAGFLGSEARLAGGQLSVLPRWGEGGRRPKGAGSGEKQSWAGPQEQRGLQATMWAPAMGPFSHRKPLGHLLGCPAWPWCGHIPYTAATVCPAVGWGTRAQGPLCGLSGDLPLVPNSRAES